jgi:hypothetical protein
MWYGGGTYPECVVLGVKVISSFVANIKEILFDLPVI